MQVVRHRLRCHLPSSSPASIKWRSHISVSAIYSLVRSCGPHVFSPQITRAPVCKSAGLNFTNARTKPSC